MSQLIECIPNFSEGRRPEVVDSIVSAIRSVSGILMLDRSSDIDHNRSVVAFAGSPTAVSEAAFRAIDEASRHINMELHTGVHPRIGAADVVPFVPLSEATLQDCADVAYELGKRVGQELNIPVYLYEAAALRPERKRLENIRRGGYEKLRDTIAIDPALEPDFGPSAVGAAGATIIGARNPLIAFNIYLSTGDIKIAQSIARTIRQSSGGLPFVKALGFLVQDRAQVSINLTDFTQTSLPTVIEAVRSEAYKRGVEIQQTELIGLIPQAALIEVARWYLQLEFLQASQILETQIANSLA
ncbi:MAG: glutamate formimidoyltransferase [Anaerolineae bacterium]